MKGLWAVRERRRKKLIYYDSKRKNGDAERERVCAECAREKERWVHLWQRKYYNRVSCKNICSVAWKGPPPIERSLPGQAERGGEALLGVGGHGQGELEGLEATWVGGAPRA